MKEEKKITQSDIEQASVRLRSIAGVSPRVYLPAVYAFCAALLLFLVLVLPGIVKNGSYLVFEGAPGKSAFYAGDAFRGSTEQSIYLPSGDYAIRIDHQGFAPETRTLKVRGRLFGSLFFPRRMKIEFSLSASAPRELLQSAYAEYAAWSLTGKPSALYQIPPVLSDAASALAGTGVLGKSPPVDPAETLPSALSFANDIAAATASPESARDGIKAGIILATAGMPGPLSMIAAARTALAVLAPGKAGAVLLQDVLDKKAAEKLAPIAAAASKEAQTASAPQPRGSISLAESDFILFSSGTLSLGGEAPSGSRASYAAAIPAFGIARTEVTNRQWAEFLGANPDWRAANKAALQDKGLVDTDYLADWNGADDKPVTGVSWHAAAAYCEWLSSKSGGTYKVILPTEAMWEAAARAGLADPASTLEKKATWSDGTRMGPARVAALGYSSAGLADLFGNVWEWTAETYRPYPALASGQLASDEKAVRGGSWANSPDSISLYSRGGIPAAHASAFLGFRPAIQQR